MVATTPEAAKIYTPKALTPGARITWVHIHDTGEEIVRTGTVWSLAPTVHGSKTFWVIPDEYDRDLDLNGPAVPVVIARKGSRIYTGCVRSDGTWDPYGGRRIRPGEAFFTFDDRTPSGALAFRQRMLYY